MSRATVEEFQENAAGLLAAVERGEQFVIARGQKAVARLLPADTEAPALLGRMKDSIEIRGDLIAPTGETWNADK